MLFVYYNLRSPALALGLVCLCRSPALSCTVVELHGRLFLFDNLQWPAKQLDSVEMELLLPMRDQCKTWEMLRTKESTREKHLA